MRRNKIYWVLILAMVSVVAACKHKTDKTAASAHAFIVFKGIYSCEPGAKIFQPCNKQSQLWVADSSKQLELQYSQIINFEQAGEPVYAELEGRKVRSDKNGNGASFDSTLIVKKVLKISKDIPADCK